MEIFDYIYLPGRETPSLEIVDPHQLALFFSILAHGALFARNSVSAPTNTQERYHVLACSALSLAPITRGVTLSTIQALFSIIRFLYHSVKATDEENCLLSSLAFRAAQMVSFSMLSALGCLVHYFLFVIP